ncbi:ABC transporter ATP-binding protein [Ruminococcus sp. HUN007]|jgi:ATP-binding cassette subfamily B protein|uniref:ABC transporter ATP-binding protein n=1 Tax=Ruminococcus sp. HUN007 TaxID=1514668 RepID=UPI0005D163D0|nr:ABC transporter ATP-binding protein [Ruminococcus sp. HUN007]
MFKTLKRIIDWCGDFKGKLYLGFVFSFFSHWFAAMPVMAASYAVGKMIDSEMNGTEFDRQLIPLSLGVLILFVFLRFLFDYIRARLQETISYELVARDRLAVGDALKRVSLGYFQNVNTGTILSSITTGLNTLENMGIRMTDVFIGGYLNFACVLIFLLFIKPVIALIAVAAAAVSFIFLTLVSKYSTRNAPVEAQANKDLTMAVIEYARGLPVVKSFGQSGASTAAINKAIADSKRIHLKIEWGFIPSNCGHHLALRCGTVALGLASSIMGISGELPVSYMLSFIFFSFIIFISLEPISDSSHILGVIDDAFDQLDMLKKTDNMIDRDGKDITPDHFDIEFSHVDFGYDTRKVLNDVSFSIPEKTSTAIVGPSGSGKTTICSLLARFYDTDKGTIKVGGHDIKEMTCDSLLKNISMVFQNVYLFNDTVRANILFGNPDASEKDMINAAKKACCHDFIMKLPYGYDTVIGEGGGTLSGGEKQRISIARAMLKNAPIIILDEATASIDPENEHLIQNAISELTRNKTIITIAHRLATIENADQILVVDNGSIIQKGKHSELIQKEGRYKQFITIRQNAEKWSISQN